MSGIQYKYIIHFKKRPNISSRLSSNVSRMAGIALRAFSYGNLPVSQGSTEGPTWCLSAWAIPSLWLGRPWLPLERCPLGHRRNFPTAPQSPNRCQWLKCDPMSHLKMKEWYILETDSEEITSRIREGFSHFNLVMKERRKWERTTTSLRAGNE